MYITITSLFALHFSINSVTLYFHLALLCVRSENGTHLGLICHFDTCYQYYADYYIHIYLVLRIWVDLYGSSINILCCAIVGGGDEYQLVSSIFLAFTHFHGGHGLLTVYCTEELKISVVP